MKVKIKKLNEGAIVPSYSKQGDAGMDLTAISISKDNVDNMTKIINLIGSPGTGKSTVASELFAKMKWMGYDVELVSEYAKELVWEERNETMKNELYLFAKQHHRLFRLNGKVKYIITDRPLILSLFYNQKYGDKSEIFNQIVLHEVNKFDNINIFLNRTKPYISKGRNQTEEESNEFAIEMKELINNSSTIDLSIDSVKDLTSKRIIEYIHEKEVLDNRTIL